MQVVDLINALSEHPGRTPVILLDDTNELAVLTDAGLVSLVVLVHRSGQPRDPQTGRFAAVTEPELGANEEG